MRRLLFTGTWSLQAVAHVHIVVHLSLFVVVLVIMAISYNEGTR
jgi:hypothetical protein